jgi:hypothetical protein
MGCERKGPWPDMRCCPSFNLQFLRNSMKNYRILCLVVEMPNARQKRYLNTFSMTWSLAGNLDIKASCDEGSGSQAVTAV